MEESRPVSAGTPSGPSGLGAGGGECGALVRAHDWASTPLGPVEQWPAALRTAVQICLESRYGMCVSWVIDLSALEFLDSSGVHMLYDIADRLATRQQRFAVVIGAEAPPRRAIELSGVEPASWLHSDQAGAQQAIGGY
jgi:anti-anti-sigma regulatory factor